MIFCLKILIFGIPVSSQEETGRNLEDFSKRCLRKCDVSDSVEAQIEDVKYECLEKCESRRKQKSREKNAGNEKIQVQSEFSETALEIEESQESEDEEWDLFGFSQDESESDNDQKGAKNDGECNWSLSAFYSNQMFFGCIAIWWVACIAACLGTIVGCLIPKWYRGIKRKRKMSQRRASVTSNWMSTRAFFSCGDKDNMIPEYQKGKVPKPYQSQFDISELPDEVFEVYNPNKPRSS